MHSPVSIVMHQRVKGFYDDDAIHIGLYGNRVVRANVEVHLSQVQKRLLIALCANAGRTMPRDRLVDAVYGDAPYGGPLGAENCVHVAMQALRTACCGLGVIIDRDALGYLARRAGEPEPAAAHVA